MVEMKTNGRDNESPEVIKFLVMYVPGVPSD